MGRVDRVGVLAPPSSAPFLSGTSALWRYKLRRARLPLLRAFVNIYLLPKRDEALRFGVPNILPTNNPPAASTPALTN